MKIIKPNPDEHLLLIGQLAANAFTGGQYGAAGGAGPAASPAPGGPNDGNAGAGGYPGLTNGLGTCSAAGGC